MQSRFKYWGDKDGQRNISPMEQNVSGKGVDSKGETQILKKISIVKGGS